MTDVTGKLRSFLVQALWPWPPVSDFANFFRHVFFNNPLFRSLHHLFATTRSTIMAPRRDSKVDDDLIAPPPRQMIHLKTKEECRLGNETIRVWTVELPSKYAEGILRCVSSFCHPHLPPNHHADRETGPSNCPFPAKTQSTSNISAALPSPSSSLNMSSANEMWSSKCTPSLAHGNTHHRVLCRPPRAPSGNGRHRPKSAHRHGHPHFIFWSVPPTLLT